MSSAFYPLGMNSKPSSGYNHKSTYNNKQYVSWKGTSVNSNPIGLASGHIRPLTNNDTGNVFQTGFGLPRPIKHYRKGRVIPPQPIIGVTNIITQDPQNGLNQININENALINYNINRFVKSSKGTSLGGGFGGSGLLNDMQDKPGAFIIKQNLINEVDGINQMNIGCNTCEGVGIVANYYPNKRYLTENPEPNTTNPILCCNPEYKAKRRAIYASTNLKKNYYTTTKQYLQNRCKTFNHKAFNFLSYQTNLDESFNTLGINSISGFFNWLNGLPDSQKDNALRVFTKFISNPYSGMPLSGPSNPVGCQLVVYKPNNYQFAKQGAVDSSTRNLKLNVDTISTNAASIQNYNNTGPLLVDANQLYAGIDPILSNLYKNKAPTCNTPWPLNFSQSGKYQNKKICHYKSLPQYQNPVSQQSPYRYFQ